MPPHNSMNLRNTEDSVTSGYTQEGAVLRQSCTHATQEEEGSADNVICVISGHSPRMKLP